MGARTIVAAEAGAGHCEGIDVLARKVPAFLKRNLLIKAHVKRMSPLGHIFLLAAACMGGVWFAPRALGAHRAPPAIPKCVPDRVLHSIDYSPLGGPYPRVPPTGEVRVAFTVLPTGKTEAIVVVSSTIQWKRVAELVLRVVESAQFETSTSACRQFMTFKFPWPNPRERD